VLERPYEGAGTCYIEFGGGMVGMVEANFFGGPTPTARLVGPSRELAADKVAFVRVPSLPLDTSPFVESVHDAIP
jgi:hypothetical protein